MKKAIGEIEKIENISDYHPNGEENWAAVKDDARICAGWYASFLDPKKEIKFTEDEILETAVKIYKEIARCKKLDPAKFKYTVKPDEMKPAAKKLWEKVVEKLTKPKIKILLDSEVGDGKISNGKSAVEKGKGEEEATGEATGEQEPGGKEPEYAEVEPSGDDSGREITIEEVLEKFDSFLIRRPFISLVGGLAIHGKTKGDIDILIKAGVKLPESFTIPLEFRILRMFDPEDRDRVHFVYDRYHGPFTSFYELADLKIERREQFMKVEMSQSDGSGAPSRRDGGRQKQTYNSPTFAYLAVYGKEPEEFLSGRSDHPQRTWNGIPVDEPLKDEWLDALKAIEGIEVRASCCGHSSERVSYIVFRLKSGCDVDAKRVSERLNRVPGCYSITDIGDEGKMRIVVAGKVWEGQDGWAGWWKKLAERIQAVVTELEVNKTLDLEAEEVEEDLGLEFSFEEIEKGLREEEFPEEFTDRARFFIETEKSEFRLTGEAGVIANREAGQSMRSDKIAVFRRFYPLKTAVSGLHAYRIAEVYSLGQSLSYLSDLYARGVR
jgi:hypothetical protein